MIKVVFWTGSGNTYAMAEAIAAGIKAAGKEAQLLNFESTSVADVADDEVIAFGCPAMGDEVLEEGFVEPFMAEYEAIANGKKVALFGSYGWGNGQWMREWVDRMKAAGATVITGDGLMANNAPDDAAIAECEAFGQAIANA